MSDKKFDRLLQDKLKGHRISFDGSRWEDMEKALNDSEHVNLIDTELRNRIKDHKYPYKESHWEILKRKLELEKELKEKIYISKIAEVTILLLLLLSVVNLKDSFIPKNNSSNNVSEQFVAVEDKTNHVSSDILVPSNLHITQTHSETETRPETINTQSPRIVNKENTTFQDNSSNPTISQDESPDQSTQTVSVLELSTTSDERIVVPTSNGVEKQELRTNNRHESFGQIGADQFDTELQHAEDRPSSTDLLDQQTQVNIEKAAEESAKTEQVQKVIATTETKPISSRLDIQENSILTKTNVNRIVHSGTSMPDLNSKLLDMNLAREIEIASLDDDNQSVFNADMAMAQPRKKKERWIGAMAGVDVNYVRSRININNVSGPRNFLVLSMTTGANYSIKKGKNEFFTGVGYSEKFYDPNIVETVVLPSTANSIESSSYYSRDYTLEHYDIVHVPAQYKRHFGASHKLHAYAFVGAAINFVIYTDYEQQDNLNRGQPRPKRLVDQKSSYKSTDFSDGLLEGGFYKDNIYFTADVGVGLEKQIRRTKFFFESQYKKNLFASQLGPRKVQLNSLSFNIGTKYKI